MPNRPVGRIVEGQTVTTAKDSDTVLEAAKRMRDQKVGAILIMHEGVLAGIFTERDALNRVIAEGLDPASTPLAAVMTPDPLTITSDKPFRNALHLMYENGYRHLPVVDDGQPIGVVSARDALGMDLVEFERDLDLREDISEILG